MKIFKKIFIFSILLFISFGLFNPNVLAEEKEIYIEDEIIEENQLAGGIVHKKIKGRSQATDPTLLSPDAKEAGLGSSKPLILNQYYTQQLNVLEIPNTTKTKLVPWGVISNGKWTLARVAIMAEDFEQSNPGWKVVAAINGDFFDISGNGNLPYTPSGTMMVDGDLYKVNTGWPMLGINNSGEGDKLVGVWKGTVGTSKTPYLYIYDENDNIIKEFEINSINTTAKDNETSVYFTMFDGNHRPIEQEVDNAYIVEQAIDTIAHSKGSLFGKGIISKYGKTTLTQNQFAIQTSNSEVQSYLKQNVKIRVQYKILSEKLNQCDSIIGYHDNVIIDGVPCYENDGYGNARLPRTLLGTRADGSIVMVVVDGRQASSGFYGICSEETGAIVDYYGMVNGFQMDGGGSATMVVRKDGELQVVNSPSDSNGQTARSDSDCILIAMQVPTIQYTAISTHNKIEITVDIINMIDEYKDLYIEVNNERKKVVNGKVVFDNLQSNTDYVYKFCSLIDGVYESIVYQGVVSTLKQMPEIASLNVSIDSSNGVDRYAIECVFNDPDNAVTYAVLVIGKTKVWLNNEMFYYSVDKGNLAILDNWVIEVNYNIQDGQGMKTLEINDCTIKYSSLDSAFDSQMSLMNSLMLDMFTINE